MPVILFGQDELENPPHVPMMHTFRKSHGSDTKRTALAAIPLISMPISTLSPSVSALLALIVSASAGFLGERILPNIGIILVTLLNSSDSFQSQTRVLGILIAVLTLFQQSLLNDTQKLVQTIQTVGIPYMIGSTRSILGCTLSIMVCHRYPYLWLLPQHAVLAASFLKQRNPVNCRGGEYGAG